MKNGYMCCKLLLNRLLRFVAGRKEVDGLSGDKKIVMVQTSRESVIISENYKQQTNLNDRRWCRWCICQIASDIYKNAFNSYFCCFSLSNFGVLQYFCTGIGKMISKMNRRKMKIGSMMALKASFPVCNHYGSRSSCLFLAQQVCRRHCGL